MPAKKKSTPIKIDLSLNNIINIYKKYWESFFIFKSGSSVRMEFWTPWVINQLITLTLLAIGTGLGASAIVMAPAFIFALATIVPSISLYGRRLINIGLSPFWVLAILVVLIPVIGPLLVLAGFLFLGVAPKGFMKK